MDEFPGILARDFGFRPQGKSAPMAASKTSSSTAAAGSNTSSWNAPRSGWNTGDSLLGDPDDVFPAPPPRFSHNPSSSAASLDAIFDGFKEPGSKPGAAGAVPSSSLPMYDKPVYDDDIFDGVPGVKSSASIRYDDVFASMASGAGSNHVSSPPAYEDILANLGKAMPERRSEERKEQDLSGFDELIPGFGGSGPPRKRETSEINQNKPAASSAKPSNSMPEDPFVVLETTSTSGHSSSGLFTDPLEHLGRPMNLERPKVDASSASGGIFDDSNAFDGHPKSVPLFTSEVNDKPKDKIPLNNVWDTSPLHNFTQKEPTQRSSVDTFEDIMPKVQSTKSSSFNKPVGSADVQSSETYGKTSMADQSPKSTEYFETADDVWLSISEIPLFTQPTTAPPPSRPPPSLVKKQAPFGANIKRKDDEYFPHHSQNYSHQKDSIRRSGVSPLDELEDFVMGKPPSFAHDRAEVVSSEEEIEKNSAAAASAAAMKEAMDRAEAKFKHAKEVRERERDAKFAKSRESAPQEIDEEVKPNAWDLEDKEMQERLEWEREQKEREEKEKEQKRLEKDRELELQRERDRARQAVDRATREARDRAAAEARLKAEKEARQRAERAAVQRAAAEARERAATDARERAAKAAAEARERAAAEARERAAAEARERAAAEARERAAAEAREREATDARERVAAKETKDKAAAERAAAERAAVNRAAAEARKRAERAAVERVAAEARERYAAASREKQQKAENDLESFFGMGSRANSAPKQRFPSPETVFDAQAQAQAQAQARGGSDSSRRTSSGSASTIRKASSTTNIVDDLSSIFGAPSSGEFQEIDGESEERRRARLERHQRTLERAAKALAEKNERDMQTQRDQAERHRIAETLDFEIKRWSAGKEGNLRALLSTLQYVLWPECGWQPVSLTDLITAVAVKKVYRKATLCIHPDKVQQKGANLQQKYIAEKVFDLLKEAWNKFNSEELF